ncbi:MAG: ribosome biogenesis GTPase Der [Opitutaceae bacterium]
MSSRRTVAIVGRPNVGKSRLFNRLARKRISIVHDQPGVTRDVIGTDIEGLYELLDTGGLGLAAGDTPDQIVKAVDAQVYFAIEMAEVVLFLMDGTEGLTSLDLEIAERLRQSGKKVLLVINKIDHDRRDPPWEEIYSLGLGEPILISAEHGRGEDDLRNAIARVLGPPSVETGPEEKAEKRLSLCILGRPNVGKSSLSNRLLKADRMIVSDVPGTTRETIEADFDYVSKKGERWPFHLTDTAGIKHRMKLSSPVEYFSQVRSIDSIRRSDVVLFVLDALAGVGRQDQAVAGEVIKENKPMIIVVNKWDLAIKALAEGTLPEYEDEKDFRDSFSRAAQRSLFFAAGSPFVYVSALTGYAVQTMLKAARDLDRRLDTVIPTGQLNQALTRLTERKPPPRIEGRRFRVFYAVQTGNRPIRIRIFCNQERRLPESYRRYLESGLVDAFHLSGCPMVFDLVGKEKRYKND